MKEKSFLKWVLFFGGILEIIIGIFMMVLHPFLRAAGIDTVPIFNQMAGTFLFGFGILLIYASQETKKYRMVPIVNIILRFLMVGFSIIQLPQYPSFLLIFIPAMIYDLLWSVIVLFLMYRLGFFRFREEK
jgi:hypothetical protein